MRNNSMVRALCLLGMRILEEEPPQDQWDVWAGGEQAQATVVPGLSHLPQCRLSARALVNLPGELSLEGIITSPTACLQMQIRSW